MDIRRERETERRGETDRHKKQSGETVSELDLSLEMGHNLSKRIVKCGRPQPSQNVN
jgi:hypothetical protein